MADSETIDIASIGLDMSSMQKSMTEMGRSVDILAKHIKKNFEETGIQVDQTAQQMKTAMSSLAFSDAARNIEEAFGGLKNVVVGLGRDIIKTADDFQTLERRLETLYHSSAKAAEMMQYVKQQAIATPFNVKELTEAAVTIKSFSQDVVTLMPKITNAAAAMGRDINDIARGVARALSGSAEGFEILRNQMGINNQRLKEYGAHLSANGELMRSNVQDMQATRKALIDLLSVEFAGGSEKRMNTLAGAVSNLEDALTNLKDKIGKDYLPVLTDMTKKTTDAVTSMENMSEMSKSVAVDIGLLVVGIGALGQGLAMTARFFVPAIAGIKALVAGFIALRVAAGKLAPGIQVVNASTLTYANSVNMAAGRTVLMTSVTNGLKVALAALPWGIVIAGITGLYLGMRATIAEVEKENKVLAEQSAKLDEVAEAYKKLKTWQDKVKSGSVLDIGGGEQLKAAMAEAEAMVEHYRKAIGGLAQLDIAPERRASERARLREGLEQTQNILASLKKLGDEMQVTDARTSDLEKSTKELAVVEKEVELGITTRSALMKKYQDAIKQAQQSYAEYANVFGAKSEEAKKAHETEIDLRLALKKLTEQEADAAKKASKVEQDALKERIDSIKTYYEEKKAGNEMSDAEEIRFISRAIARIKQFMAENSKLLKEDTDFAKKIKGDLAEWEKKLAKAKHDQAKAATKEQKDEYKEQEKAAEDYYKRQKDLADGNLIKEIQAVKTILKEHKLSVDARSKWETELFTLQESLRQKRLNAEKAIEDELFRLTHTAYETEKRNLEKLIKEYENLGLTRAEINDWIEAKNKELDDAEGKRIKEKEQERIDGWSSFVEGQKARLQSIRDINRQAEAAEDISGKRKYEIAHQRIEDELDDFRQAHLNDKAAIQAQERLAKAEHERLKYEQAKEVADKELKLWEDNLEDKLRVAKQMESEGKAKGGAAGGSQAAAGMRSQVNILMAAADELYAYIQKNRALLEQEPEKLKDLLRKEAALRAEANSKIIEMEKEKVAAIEDVAEAYLNKVAEMTNDSKDAEIAAMREVVKWYKDGTKEKEKAQEKLTKKERELAEERRKANLSAADELFKLTHSEAENSALELRRKLERMREEGVQEVVLQRIFSEEKKKLLQGEIDKEKELQDAKKKKFGGPMGAEEAFAAMNAFMAGAPSGGGAKGVDKNAIENVFKGMNLGGAFGKDQQTKVSEAGQKASAQAANVTQTFSMGDMTFIFQGQQVTGSKKPSPEFAKSLLDMQKAAAKEFKMPDTGNLPVYNAPAYGPLS